MQVHNYATRFRSSTARLRISTKRLRLSTKGLRLGISIWITAALLAIAAPAAAIPIDVVVGTGANTATVVLEFGDGAEYAFEVLFDTVVPATNGIEILQVLEAELATFSIVLANFGFGDFVDGIAFDGHSDAGFVAPEGYWHYWTREAELDPWISSLVGASDRVLVDGSWDGWRYGSAFEPLPEPSTAMLLAVGIGLVLRARRAQPSPLAASSLTSLAAPSTLAAPGSLSAPA